MSDFSSLEYMVSGAAPLALNDTGPEFYLAARDGMFAEALTRVLGAEPTFGTLNDPSSDGPLALMGGAAAIGTPGAAALAVIVQARIGGAWRDTALQWSDTTSGFSVATSIIADNTGLLGVAGQHGAPFVWADRWRCRTVGGDGATAMRVVLQPIGRIIIDE